MRETCLSGKEILRTEILLDKLEVGRFPACAQTCAISANSLTMNAQFALSLLFFILSRFETKYIRIEKKK